MTEVVNIRDFPGGRLPSDCIRICRPSPWGNPFVIGRAGEPRESVIRMYRLWLENVLWGHPDFLEPLRGKKLACWCAPLPCHGDVIAEFLEKT